MSNRNERARLAEETVQVLSDGRYTAPSGRQVQIAAKLEAARRATELFAPERGEELLAEGRRLLARLDDRPPVELQVVNQTTLAATRQLAEALPGQDTLALNFASARNPGGGFLGGSQAQEESLARSSGLYACLLTQPGYYEANRACGTAIYTDHVIYSPRVPVFRDDAGGLLETPYDASFITAPAVNAGAVRRDEPENVERIEATMRRRIELVLTIALLRGHRTLVLGAWGCGVFENDPAQVAGWFGELLLGRGAFARAFERAVFAVLDRSAGGTILGPFERALG